MADNLETIKSFHRMFYESVDTWWSTYWLGVKALKCPFDLWHYQEILFETKPDLIIECGTAFGGSALFMASMCDIMGRGKIVSVDIERQPNLPGHPRITYLDGSSVSPETVGRVKGMIGPSDRVMAILDSDHHKAHVLQEIAAYSPLVTPGNYLVVEDTNINGNPVMNHMYPGPKEAVEEFLATATDFIVDHSKERFLLTFNPGGYLKRIGRGVRHILAGARRRAESGVGMKYTAEHAKRPTDIHEHLVTLYGLVVGLGAKTVLELGVRGGESTVPLLEGLHTTGGRLISVDIDTCGAARQMIENYGLTGRWTFAHGDDVEFGLKWDRSSPIDMIFIDTSHLYEHTKREIEVFGPLVRPGGFLVFHDTVSFPDGVMKPIQEFLQAHSDWRFESADNCNGLGVMIKPM